MDSSFPNLFLIGVAKSATTTLHGILEQHPQVFMCSPKEPRFFSRETEYVKGVQWYQDTYFYNASGYDIRGEATPTYLFMRDKTAPRIKAALAGRPARFIAIFRNPVDRAYSHYWFNRNTKLSFKEDLTFEEALLQENERITNDPYFQDRGSVNYAYFNAGLYDQQLPLYLDTFGAENFLLLTFEELFAEQYPSTLAKIERFLGVTSAEIPLTKKKESILLRSKGLASLMRQSRPLRKALSFFLPVKMRSKIKSAVVEFNNVPFKYPPMAPETRAKLLERCMPSIEWLENLLEKDLNSWKR